MMHIDTSVLADRYEQRGISSDYFTPGRFHHLFPPLAVDYTKESFEKRFITRLNTDKRPVTYFLNLLLWDRIAGGRTAAFFLRLYHLSPWYFFLPLFLLLLYRSRGFLRKSFSRLTPRPRPSILFAMTTTGFLAMALEIVLIFLYQNIFGYLYQKIGLIVALFMFGLFLGAMLSPRIFEKKRPSLNILIFCEALLLLLALLLSNAADFLLYLSRTLPLVSEPFFFMILTGVGILAGCEFPLAADLYRKEGQDDAARASAVIDSTDHLGACAGALITGIILMPLLGILCTGLFLATLKAASLVPLLIIRRSADSL